MPEEFQVLLRRLDTTERNNADLAKSVSAIVDELSEIQKPLDELRLDRAARVERDIRHTEHFARIEKRLDAITKLGWWVLTAFGTSAIALVMNFVAKGGLIVN